MSFGQFAATSQFFLYGKKHFTKTGYEKHRRTFSQPDFLTTVKDVSHQVFMISGANSGIGKEVAKFLGGQGATVFLVCRNRERGEQARGEIRDHAQHQRIHLIVADMGVEEDVRRCWREFTEHSGKGVVTPTLHGLVCNAGALSNEKTLTKDGIETTFASHLLFGTYLLGSLALPALKATEGGRLVVVSSGGMYNVPFPDWETATSVSTNPKFKFDGQLAYAYAKRGQVLLCERWAVDNSAVKVVSCHPGWVDSPGVEQTYGEQRKYLEPMRTLWEGAEHICWLCLAPAHELESGAFYLDREPQVKHLSGPFFSEGSYTKNSSQDVDSMMRNLDEWSNGIRPVDLKERHDLADENAQARDEGKLQPMEKAIDLKRFMGRWYVHANIPTFADKNTINNIEDYELDEATNQIHVTFTYMNHKKTKSSQFLQRAKVKNEANTRWSLSPKFGVYLPLKLPYLVAECADDYSYTIVGLPDRSHLWIMTRDPHPEPSIVDELIHKAARLGFDKEEIVKVPQDWSDVAEGAGVKGGA